MTLQELASLAHAEIITESEAVLRAYAAGIARGRGEAAGVATDHCPAATPDGCMSRLCEWCELATTIHTLPAPTVTLDDEIEVGK